MRLTRPSLFCGAQPFVQPQRRPQTGWSTPSSEAPREHGNPSRKEPQSELQAARGAPRGGSAAVRSPRVSTVAPGPLRPAQRTVTPPVPVKVPSAPEPGLQSTPGLSTNYNHSPRGHGCSQRQSTEGRARQRGPGQCGRQAGPLSPLPPRPSPLHQCSCLIHHFSPGGERWYSHSPSRPT